MWSTCSKTCHGRLTRTRKCDKPPPSPGYSCPGPSSDYAMCNYKTKRCKGSIFILIQAFATPDVFCFFFNI